MIQEQLNLEVNTIYEHIRLLEAKDVQKMPTTPAITAVTPRGTTSFKAIYGTENVKDGSQFQNRQVKSSRTVQLKPAPDELGKVKRPSSRVRIKYKTDQDNLAELTPVLHQDLSGSATSQNSARSKTNYL